MFRVGLKDEKYYFIKFKSITIPRKSVETTRRFIRHLVEKSYKSEYRLPRKFKLDCIIRLNSFN